MTDAEILALYDRLHLAELEGTGIELTAAEVRFLRQRLLLRSLRRAAKSATRAPTTEQTHTAERLRKR
jgi:hypothetical protein